MMAAELQFDQAAQNCLAVADKEARRLNHSYIGTEHLLLAVLEDQSGTASRILRRLGIDFAALRADVEATVDRGETPPAGDVGMTPRARQVVALAGELARSGGREMAGAEHLLLAITTARDPVGPGKSVAAGILSECGVTAERILAELPAVLAAGEETRRAPADTGLEGTAEEARRLSEAWEEQRRRPRRYSLVMPDDLFAEVERLAQRRSTTVVDLLRQFTRLGLLALQVQDRRDAALIIREGGVERELLIL